MRDGLNPVRLQLPHGSTAETVLEHLAARFPDDAARLRAKVAAGEVVDEIGRPLGPDAPYVAGTLVYLYRDAAPEARVPFEIDVLHHDDDLLVIDKPHFLASTPRGAYVVESAVVRLRRDLGLPEISPAHRLDRITAGVLVLTTRREVRGAYQQLFASRTIRKTYEAVAAVDPSLELPTTVRSRIVKEHGTLVAQEVEGEPNAESRIALVETRAVADVGGDAQDSATRPSPTVLGRYVLEPHTGKTHQLRLHMASLGLPILNDNFYPSFYDVAPDDYAAPLQLLARSVSFVDPLSGDERTFTSRRTLDCWPTGV